MSNETIQILQTVSVSQHLTAFRMLTESTKQDINNARVALGELLKRNGETMFQKIDDAGMLIVLLEMFLLCASYTIKAEVVGAEFGAELKTVGNC